MRMFLKIAKQEEFNPLIKTIIKIRLTLPPLYEGVSGKYNFTTLEKFQFY